jgi:hypothetical protein
MRTISIVFSLFFGVIALFSMFCWATSDLRTLSDYPYQSEVAAIARWQYAGEWSRVFWSAATVAAIFFVAACQSPTYSPRKPPSTRMVPLMDLPDGWVPREPPQPKGTYK